MTQTIQDYWNMSPLAAVGAVILLFCAYGNVKGRVKTVGCVLGGALLLIGMVSFLCSL